MSFIKSYPKTAAFNVGTAFTLAILNVASAQTAPSEPKMSLPEVVVNEPVQPKAKPKAKRLVQQKPVLSAQQNRAQPSLPTAPRPFASTPLQGQAPQVAPIAGSNPNADPVASYKIDRVTNTKITQPVLDTARTIITIPKEVIADKGATSVRDVARTAPGITLGTGEGGNTFGDRIFIRGFDARNDFYIDGVRDVGVPSRESFNMEQMEILKGPSSSVGGRGTTGGAVNIAQKKPAVQNFTNVDTTFGTDMTKRVAVDINRVFSEKWAMRVNAMGHDANVAGRDKTYETRFGLAGAVTYTHSPNFKATADYNFLKTKGLPDWGVPYNSAANAPLTETGLNRNTYYGIVNRDFQKGTANIGTLTLEGKINDALKYSNKIRMGETIIDYMVTAPSRFNPLTNTVNLSSPNRYQVNSTLANLTDFTYDFSALGLKHTFVTGLELSRERISRDTYRALDSETNSVIPTSYVVDAWNPNTSGLWNDYLQRANQMSFVTVNTSAIHFSDTIKFSPQWIVNFGGRVDNYSISSEVFGLAAVARKDTLFNYNAGITYKPLPNGSIYAAFGTSSNPVGQELDSNSPAYGGVNAASSVLAPERNTSMELGTKWELFNRHLLLTTALFRTTKENARESSGTGAATVWADTGSYQTQGLELGVQGNINPRLSVYGGYVAMDSSILKSNLTTNVGRMLANIAHDSFNLLTKYKLTDNLTIGGQATYKGKINGGTFADNGNRLPASWRYDLLSQYQINKTMTLKINVNNILNTVSYDAFYTSASPYVYVAPGRSATLTLSSKF